MQRLIYYGAQAFEANMLGELKRLRPREAHSAAHACRMAEALAGAGGAVAYSRSADETGEFGELEILARFGQVPREFR